MAARTQKLDFRRLLGGCESWMEIVERMGERLVKLNGMWRASRRKCKSLSAKVRKLEKAVAEQVAA